MQVLLIRHALPLRVENEVGPADPVLSELGRRQAAALAGWLAEERIDAVYTSPLRRALETADPLATMLGQPAVVADGVAEFDRHSAEYVPLEELKAANDPRWQRMVDGEHWEDGLLSPEEFRDQVVAAVERIVADHAGQSVAVVCHGGVVNAYLGHVLGLPMRLFFEPAYTSISRVLASGAGHRTLVSVNETAHLRGLA